MRNETRKELREIAGLMVDASTAGRLADARRSVGLARDRLRALLEAEEESGPYHACTTEGCPTCDTAPEPEPEEGEPDRIHQAHLRITRHEGHTHELRERIEALEEVAHEPKSIPIGNIMARLEALENRVDGIEPEVAHCVGALANEEAAPEPDSVWDEGADATRCDKAESEIMEAFYRLRSRPSEEAVDRVVKAARDLCGPDLSSSSVPDGTPPESWIHKKEELKAALRALESLRTKEGDDQ